MRYATAMAMLMVLLLTAVSSFAGENAAALFSIGTSVRAYGLGGAFLALADDEGAVFHNPSALAWYDGIGVASFYSQQYAGIGYGGIGFVTSYVGLEFLALDSGAIESGSSSFTYASQGGVVSFGIPLDPVAVGFRFRYFHVSSPQTAAGWSLDPALTVKIDFLRASLMYEGALTDEITWEDGTQESWEQGLAIGVAATLRPFEAVVCSAAFEADGLFSSSAGVCAGLETWVGGLGARAGYGTTGLTFGLSVAVFGFQLDWAYVMHADLGDSHRASLSVRF